VSCYDIALTPCFVLFANRAKKEDDPSPPPLQEGDYERAEKEIFRAIGKAEQKMQHAIEKEVDGLYHKDTDPKEKEKVKKKAKTAVKEGAKKVKQAVDDVS
jgi:hypothetical protein